MPMYPHHPSCNVTKGVRAEDAQVCGRLVCVFLGDNPDDRLPCHVLRPGGP